MNKKTLLLSGLGLGLLGVGAASADEVYTVVPGDTVSSIAQKFNTTVEKIDEKNNLTDVNMIHVGQKLTIPTLSVQKNTYVAPIKQQTVQYTQPVVKQVAQTTQTTQQTVTQQSTQKVVQQSVQTKVQQPIVKQQEKPTQTVKSSNSGSVNAYRERRKQIESNGNYSTNTGNGYWGAYQFAPATVRGIEAQTGMKWDWSKKTQDAFADYYAQSKYGGWQNVPTTGGW